MHKSLTPRFNLICVALYLSLLSLVLILTSWQQSIRLIFIALLVGAVAGVLQARAMAVRPKQFLTSGTTMDVRRAILASMPGKLSLVLLWGTAASSLVWAIRSNPSNPFFIWIAGYTSFAVARDLCALRAVFRLNRLQ
jgi:hypothetical protein